MKLDELRNLQQLKTMNMDQLNSLCSDIRKFLIQSISLTGGHLSSNLGVVELTVALHTVFSSPKDKIIFDVGHQCYTHKLLTGRKDQFPALRKYKGLSGYQKRKESKHDPWEAGHSSTSVSAGLGMAAARDLLGEEYEVISVIGDGALGGGMALEALNDLGAQKRKMIVIFNDNNMSISANNSAIERSITRVRTSHVYRETKKDLSSSLSGSQVGRGVLGLLKNTKEVLKHTMIEMPLFSHFGLDYIGPVDGHSLPELINALQTAKEHDGPVVVHVITQKGKGYPFAQQDMVGDWHGVAPFDICTGKPKVCPQDGVISWSAVISRTLMHLAARNPKLAVITPAMANGSALIPFAKAYPRRFFDCGIAEEHAVTMAAGMAQGGIQPFLSIYSSFLQRAYDQVLHDVARMDLPVVFGIDRAGLVGDDGETHQGIYDIAFLRTIPNTIIAQPKDAVEAQHLIYSAFQAGHPYFVRYPRGKTVWTPVDHYENIPVGTWTSMDVGTPEAVVITYGPDVDKVMERAQKSGKGLRVVNARFFQPLDVKMLHELAQSHLPLFVFESDSPAGGLSQAIAAEMESWKNELQILSLRDGFVEQGSIEQLRKEQGISLDDLFERLDHHASGSMAADKQ